LPRLEVILNTQAEIEALSAQVGLKIVAHFLQQEIEHCCGPWGQQTWLPKPRRRQTAYRHGQQRGLEETLTLHRLGLNEQLRRRLSSTCLPAGRPT
jgi:hypothetical protein